jgi:two-component system chemotaxis response regulator CheY
MVGAVDPNLKILVVDDFAPMRVLIRRLLREVGLTNTYAADDGASALAFLRREHFDFLITDWSMPGMSGIELVRSLRDDPKLRSLPVLFITAEARGDRVREAQKAGIDGFIVKPFTPLVLYAKIERALARPLVA